jgi:hypothetical protein
MRPSVSTEPISPIDPRAAPNHQMPGISASSSASCADVKPSGMPNAHAHRVAAYTTGTAMATHVARIPPRAARCSAPLSPTRCRRWAEATTANNAAPAMQINWLTTGHGTCEAIVAPSGHPNGLPTSSTGRCPIATSGR